MHVFNHARIHTHTYERICLNADNHSPREGGLLHDDVFPPLACLIRLARALARLVLHRDSSARPLLHYRSFKPLAVEKDTHLGADHHVHPLDLRTAGGRRRDLQPLLLFAAPDAPQAVRVLRATEAA